MNECQQTVAVHAGVDWGKRKRDEISLSEPTIKRPRYNWYVRLESESSVEVLSDEDRESVHSIQDRETDVVRDTSDTETRSVDYDIDVEFEVESLSENNDEPSGNDSSSGADDLYIAAVLADSSLEAWASDGEDSCSTSTTDFEYGRTDFWTCAQCKSKNNNPQYRLCEKCFQVRKTVFPPRPKRTKKRKLVRERREAVNVDKLRSCLKGLSQDSGLGSSQEFPSLGFEQIKVPQPVSRRNSESTSSSDVVVAQTRKRKNSEDEENRVPKKILLRNVKEDESVCEIQSPEEKTKDIETVAPIKSTKEKELCGICNISNKDSVFLHGNSGHTYSCYKCGVRSWKTNKRCPVCNRRVQKVIKLFTA